LRRKLAEYRGRVRLVAVAGFDRTGIPVRVTANPTTTWARSEGRRLLDVTAGRAI